MKKIIKYVRLFVRREFLPSYYACVAAFLAVAIWVNYALDFEESIIEGIALRTIRFPVYFLFYATAFYYCALLYGFFYEKTCFLRKRGFWTLSLFAVAVPAADDAFNFRLEDLLEWQLVHPHLSYLAVRALNNATQLFLLVLPATLWWLRSDSARMGLYGLRTRGFDPKPYFLMLALIAPLIFLVSFRADFLEAYPRYHDTMAAAHLRLNPFWTFLFFEFWYSLAFVGVEFFYRGFLVLALAKYLGRGAVMPMVAVYCFTHFQKPMPETVSSIFGGLLLGIIVYYGRSIYGGVIAHLGVAWMMEIAAFVQIYVFRARG